MSSAGASAAAVPGGFSRLPSVFHNLVEASPGSRFAVASGRYHLYVSYACPWAHRCLLTRALMGLEAALPVSVVHPVFTETAPGKDDHRGWHFGTDFEGATGDQVGGATTVREIYETCAEASRFTVPFLWDCKEKVIVNNESSEIVRMLSTAFRQLATTAPVPDLYPEGERAAIDEACTQIYEINNGVYRCGFAKTQEAYEAAVGELYVAVEAVERRLSSNAPYVAGGDQLSLADVQLFPTLVRFDEVYVNLFKCNRKQVADSPALMRYMRRLWAIPAFRDTTRMDHIKSHYYRSIISVNPTQIVPTGPNFLALLDQEDPSG